MPAGMTKGETPLTAFSLAQLLRQPLDFLLLVEVGRNGVGLALAESIELLDGFLACFCIARGYVHGSSVRHITFRDHPADAFGAPGNEDYFPLKTERS